MPSAVMEALEKASREHPKHPTKPIANRHQWRRVFIRALAECGNTTRAAQMAGVNVVWARQCKGREPDFARQWDEAFERYGDAAVERIENALDDRAVNGRSRTIVIKGQAIEVQDKPSDKAAEIRLKALRPEVYDRKSIQSGPSTVNIVNVDARQLILSPDPAVRAALCTIAAARSSPASACPSGTPQLPPPSQVVPGSEPA